MQPNELLLRRRREATSEQSSKLRLAREGQRSQGPWLVSYESVVNK